jgi:hypothetical protein
MRWEGEFTSFLGEEDCAVGFAPAGGEDVGQLDEELAGLSGQWPVM